MKSFVSSIALYACILTSTNAFTVPMSQNRIVGKTFVPKFNLPSPKRSLTGLYESSGNDDEKDNEIERLRSMAAKLRAEASLLEVSLIQMMLL